jgi:hypothetical protein
MWFGPADMYLLILSLQLLDMIYVETVKLYWCWEARSLTVTVTKSDLQFYECLQFPVRGKKATAVYECPQLDDTLLWDARKLLLMLHKSSAVYAINFLLLS